MADRYWVGGTATWNATAGTKWSTTSGGAGGASAPTAADDMFLDALSLGTSVVTLASTPCRSLTCTGFTGTLSLPASTTLTVGDGTAGAGNVAILLVAGMTFTVGSATTSLLSFVSTSATQQTINTGGKTMPSWTINGAGSSYSLADTNTVAATSTVTVTSGALTTNNQTCSWGLFACSGAVARSLTLGSSAITITGTVTVWNMASVTNMTFSAGTSVITCTGAAATFYGGTATFATLVMNGSGAARLGSAGQTYGTLTRTGTAVKTDSFVLFGNQTITGTLTITGNSAINRMSVISDVVGTARTLTAAVVSLTNANFMDTTGAGAAAPFTGTSLGNALGNSGITFDASVTQTHTASVGGNYSDVTKWTSRVPLPQDNVVVDVNTTGTLTMDMPQMGKDHDFTGFAGTSWWASVGTTIFGSLTLSTSMTVSGGAGTVLAGRGAHTVTSAGKTFGQGLTVSGPSGTYTLQDAIGTNAALTINDGTFVDNGFAVTCLSFASVSGRTRGLTRSGAWTITSTAAVTVWNVSATGLTMTSAGASITISTASANTRTFAGGGQTYGTLTHTVAGSTGALVITGANTTFATVNFSDATNARTLTLPAGSTIFITSAFNVNGTAGTLMTVNSSTPGTAATLSKSSGVISTNYLSIQDSTATGGATWFAGPDSTNVSGNTGWVFTWPALTISDTGSGADAVSIGAVSVAMADTSSGADAVSIAATLTRADTGAGTDALSMAASLTQADTGSGADALSLGSVAVTVADTTAGADALSITASSSTTDTGSGADAYGPVTVSLAVPDTGSGMDGLTLSISTYLLAADNGTGVDALAITASVLTADTGSGIDAVVFAGAAPVVGRGSLSLVSSTGRITFR